MIYFGKTNRASSSVKPESCHAKTSLIRALLSLVLKLIILAVHILAMKVIEICYTDFFTTKYKIKINFILI